MGERRQEGVPRRGFLRLTGGAIGAALVSGCTLDLQRQVWMEPYVKAPEQTLPGEDFWFASTCRMCPAGCGIIVRVSNGRARKVEGNPEHPLNRGRLCARGQAGLQLLYHPDRVRQVMARTGERGEGRWAGLAWDQALAQVEEKLRGADPGRVAILAGYLPSHLRQLLVRFAEGLGAPPPLFFDLQTALDGRRLLTAVSQDLFGVEGLPVFDIGNADMLYGFGPSFLETWLSPVAYAGGYSNMRGRGGVRGVFIAFEPRLSMTSASADRWYPVAPGTEGLLALALGKVIVDEGLGHPAPHTEHARLYQGLDVRALAERVGLGVEEIASLARRFADAHHPIAIPGGLLAGYPNGAQMVKAVEALNFVVGHTGDHGAMFLAPPPPARQLEAPPPSRFAEVAALVERMKAGEVEVLLLLGANPVYELPPGLGVAEALAKVGYVVSLSVLLDETAALADLVLPMHTYLESWGLEVVEPAFGQVVVGAQQPVVRPLWDSRDPADVLLALAQRLGGEVARRLPWPDLVTYLQTRLPALQQEAGSLQAANSETFWALWLQHGGWWSEDRRWIAPELRPDLEPFQAVEAEFEGDAGEYPLHLLPVATVTLGDGRHAGLPWLQEAPDPMTTGTWDTWVEVHPETAASLGIRQDEVVRVVTPHGAIDAVAYLTPAVRPDVVAVPVGQGHGGMGRWAAGRGANVLQVLAPKQDPASGEWAWAATRARLEPTGRRRVLPRLEDNFGVDLARQQGLVPGG